MTLALNWIDYLFIAIFIFSIISGFVKGLMREVIALIALVGGVYLGVTYSVRLATYFMGDSGDAPTNMMVAVSFLILFVGAIIAGAFIGYLANLVMRAGGAGIANRILGGLFGLLRATLLSIVIVFVVQLTPSANDQTWQESKAVIYFQPWAVWLSQTFAPAIEEMKNKMGQTMDNMKQKVNSTVENVTTPQSPADAATPNTLAEPAATTDQPQQ